MEIDVVFQGDSLQEMARLPGESVDLIFAAPPYWMCTEGILTRVEGTSFEGRGDGWDKFSNLSEYEKFTKD